MAKVSALFSVFSYILLSASAHAQQNEVVVIGTASPITEPSRSRSTLKAKQLEPVPTVTDALRSVPGVEVVRQGSIGQPTTVFIRGARSEDTLVLIDGIEMNDAGSTAGAFDFTSITPYQLTEVEVLRGPQGVSYGPGALGGVVNLTTDDGSIPMTRYRLEGGSFDTHHASLAHGGRRGAFRYSLGIDHLRTAGFSAAEKTDGNTEADGFRGDTVSGKITWDASLATRVILTTRVADSATDLDRHGGPGGDDPNATANFKQSLFGLEARHRYQETRLRLGFAASFSEVDREGRNAPDGADNTDSTDHFLSERARAQTDADWIIGDAQSLKFRFQWRNESAVSHSVFDGATTSIDRQSTAVAGPSLTYYYDDDLWFGDAGVRVDQSSIAGAIPTERLSLGRQISALGLRANLTFGTGYKLPSLYQLYSTYGDSSLREERSRAWEVSFERNFDSLMMVVTGFWNQYENLIDFDPARSRYYNTGAARASGIEVQSEVSFKEGFLVTAGYTFSDARDSTTGLRLLRRPLNTWSIGSKYRIDRFEAITEYRFRGERSDLDPIAYTRISNAAYGLWNANASYRLRDELKIFGRIENILNTEYREVAGYGTAGLSGYLGLSGEI